MFSLSLSKWIAYISSSVYNHPYHVPLFLAKKCNVYLVKCVNPLKVKSNYVSKLS
jgi:hypothetical protein